MTSKTDKVLSEQVFSAVDGQKYRWQRKRDGSLCVSAPSSYQDSSSDIELPSDTELVLKGCTSDLHTQELGPVSRFPDKLALRRCALSADRMLSQAEIGRAHV